eukprot:1175539-Prorocentrum_minimum.AAC.3
MDSIADHMKGSYYANPIVDVPTSDPELIARYPSYCRANIWPNEVPELEPAFKDLGQLIVEVGSLVARHCDKYIDSECSAANTPSVPTKRLERIIRNSLTHKARLLHYFPADPTQSVDNSNKDEVSTWCGWHNDHGTLTGKGALNTPELTGNNKQALGAQQGKQSMCVLRWAHLRNVYSARCTRVCCAGLTSAMYTQQGVHACVTQGSPPQCILSK